MQNGIGKHKKLLKSFINRLSLLLFGVFASDYFMRSLDHVTHYIDSGFLYKNKKTFDMHELWKRSRQFEKCLDVK